MSATGRNLAGHERRADDFYATPAWCTELILPHLSRARRDMDPMVVFDPCCGNGAILDVARKRWPVTMLGIEIDEERAAYASASGHLVQHADALPLVWSHAADVLVTNPPYSLAMEFILRGIGWITSMDRQAAFLTRLNFLGSQKRADFHRQHPCDVFVLPRRPSFTGGGTDATEYCWMVWGPGRGNRWSIL